MNQGALERVIGCFAEMPGIGPKTAQRLAYFMLNRETHFVFELADSLRELKEKLCWCTRCFSISETEVCQLCSQPNRSANLLCVVEDAVNVANVERSGGYNGYYHVLQGVLSPINGIGPDDLRVKELFERLSEGAVKELILATNPTVEGEATAMFLADSLVEYDIIVSRIAVGIPIGSNLDYCDEITMAKALENRRLINS